MSGYTSELVYVGTHDSVTTERPDGTRGTTERGGTFKTTAEHADGLLQQPDNWQPAKKAKAARDTTTED